VKPNRIVVLGGSGFVGRHLVNELAGRGREVVVATRAREHAKALFLLPRVEIVETDVRDTTALTRITRGADAIVNLVGILNQTRGASFNDLHVGVTDSAIRACRNSGVSRLLHMSSLNADPNGPSAYLRSKGEAEEKVTGSGLAWTIFQPSVIFGPEDRFLNTFAFLSRLMPVVFLAGAKARFQPIYIGDVVKAFATALDDDGTIGQRYKLCGPTVYTLRDLVKYAGSMSADPPLVIGLPNALAHVQAWILEALPGKLLTRDNLASMRLDSVCDCPYPAVFGGRARSMESVVPTYLSRAARSNSFSAYRQRRR
jgi:NADH dehydrogenase